MIILLVGSMYNHEKEREAAQALIGWQIAGGFMIILNQEKAIQDQAANYQA